MYDEPEYSDDDSPSDGATLSSDEDPFRPMTESDSSRAAGKAREGGGGEDARPREACQGRIAGVGGLRFLGIGLGWAVVVAAVVEVFDDLSRGVGGGAVSLGLGSGSGLVAGVSQKWESPLERQSPGMRKKPGWHFGYGA